jgi:hypothetical protein
LFLLLGFTTKSNPSNLTTTPTTPRVCRRRRGLFYERELARIGAELAASGEAELWRVHGVVDLAVGMLRGVIAAKGE